ncbi:enoyl-CoA hydratase-related protein, partial [Staphylococcus aureus]|nr:enoyl-CoA hydratase-related protein [Staphylococcus aureus]
MRYETLRIGIEDRIATIVVDRPEKRNALNAVVRRELVDALDALRDDDGVRVVVLTGEGDRAFVAGADITEFAERSPLQQRDAMDG